VRPEVSSQVTGEEKSSTPEAAVPVETLKPPLLQSTPKTERKNNPIVAIDQQRRHIDSRQKTAPAWRSNPAIQHQHFTEAQKPPPPQSDRNPKEENQKLETGKTSADTPQNRFSIPKKTRKNTTPSPLKSRQSPKREKFIEKQIYHKPLGRREAESNTLKGYFCLQRKKLFEKTVVTMSSLYIPH